MKTMRFTALLTLLLAGCTVGPDYRRPLVAAPDTFRGAPAATPPTDASFGEQKWWDVFQDSQLQTLIRTALQNNYDVRIAATRILEAQAQLGIKKADEYPTAGVSVSGTDNRNARSNTSSAVRGHVLRYTRHSPIPGLIFIWDRLARRLATHAARAQLIARCCDAGDVRREALVRDTRAHV